MEDDKRIGKGRRDILLKIIRAKEKADAEAAAAAAAAAATTATTADTVPSVTMLSQVAEPLGSIPAAGRGRASLLDTIRKMKETSGSQPHTIASLCRGRGLSIFPPPSSVPQTTIKTNIPGPSVDAAGVLGKLSDITIEEGVLGKLSDITIEERNVSLSDALSSQEIKLKPQQGTGGKPVQLSANYINVKLDANKGLYNYEVKCNPEIDSRPLRNKLLSHHVEVIGRTKVFDGVTLCLPQKLKQNITTLQSPHPIDGSTVTLSVIYKKQQNMSENITFFNMLLNRVSLSLCLVRIGQHNFNPKGIHAIPQHKIEVWPGYVTAINEYQGGLKLCIDAKHRVMCTETVRDIMVGYGNKQNFRQLIMKEIIGMPVFTRYNNKAYRVDDIAWDKNPTFTFTKGTEEICILDYYKQHWNLQIRDHGQPLLVHFRKIKKSTGEPEEQMLLLVPEFCYVASMTDSIRSDFRAMKDLDEVTKMSPNARCDVIKHFVQAVQSNDIPRKLLADWGVHLENDLTKFTGRLLEPEEITFGQNRKFIPPPHKPAEWSNAACRNPMLRAPDLNEWCVLYCQRDSRCSHEFVDMFKKVSKAIGLTSRQPRMICLRDDRIETYIHELRRNIHRNINLMVIIFPTNRTDRYAAVKRLCCVEMPVPSQVIMSRTISRADKLKSITEKIALQVNCKMGGALWALAIPMDNCMICGIDVYHGGAKESTKGSVAGFVASLDKLLTAWHSKVCMQGRNQELVDMLQVCMISALRAYYKRNARYPDRIIVYRDGVGDGQIETIADYEVRQLLATFRNIEPGYQPALTVIAVHKHINTRIFSRAPKGLENPSPGTIVDICITRPNVYDFFLVSQQIRVGTVTPTRYIVIYDDKNMRAEHIQRLTFKLCHLYYNWAGTIKIPAPCQYAHKLVSLIGQCIQAEPHQSFSDTLYYL